MGPRPLATDGIGCLAVIGPAAQGRTALSAALSGMDRLSRHRLAPDRLSHGRGDTALPGDLVVLADERAGTVVDVPDGREFAAEARAAALACDAAVVVTDGSERSMPALQVALRELEDRGIPRIVFVNARRDGPLLELLARIDGASQAPAVMRHLPVWSDGIAVGLADLMRDRAWIFREDRSAGPVRLDGAGAVAALIEAGEVRPRIRDHADPVVDLVVTDIDTIAEAASGELGREIAAGLACPVVIGDLSAGSGLAGLRGTLAALGADIASTRARLGIDPTGPCLVEVVSRRLADAGEDVRLARVMRGRLRPGTLLRSAGGAEVRVLTCDPLAGVCGHGDQDDGALLALRTEPPAVPGTFSAAPGPPVPLAAPAIEPVLRRRLVAAADPQETLPLAAMLLDAIEGDPGACLLQEDDTLVLASRGPRHEADIRARVLRDHGGRLKLFAAPADFRETVERVATIRHRYGGSSRRTPPVDVTLTVQPLPPGSGVVLDTGRANRASGRARRAFALGLEEAARRGRRGVPLADVAVTRARWTAEGRAPSEAALQGAARAALAQALAAAGTRILEPVAILTVDLPQRCFGEILETLTGLGAELGTLARRRGWKGFLTVTLVVPDSNLDSLLALMDALSREAASVRAIRRTHRPLGGRAVRGGPHPVADEGFGDPGLA